MGKISSFTRRFLTFYFGSFWAAFRHSWKWTATAATALGIVVPLLLHFAKLRQGQEGAVISLIWQIPVAIFLVLMVMMLFYVPFSNYEALKKRSADNETNLLDQLKTKGREIYGLQKAAEEYVREVNHERQQKDYARKESSERQDQIIALIKERDSFKSQIDRGLTPEQRKELLALQKQGGELTKICRGGGGPNIVEKTESWESKTAQAIREIKGDAHGGMFLHEPIVPVQMYGHQPWVMELVGRMNARMSVLNGIIKELSI
jgi:hypothetical protein